MGLPAINESISYTLNLPYSDKKIKYRPYFVKEQKILLMAQETNNEDEIVEAIKKIAQNCTFGAVDIESLPTFELEYLFLNIRCKSVGENVDVNVTCKTCGKKKKVKIDLSKIQLPKNNVNNTVMLNKQIGLKLKYPSISTYKDLNLTNKTQLTNQEVLKVIPRCVESIFDDKQVYVVGKDTTFKEVEEFIENLTDYQVEDIAKFFNNIPTLNHKVSFDCEGCKEKNQEPKKELLLEGIQSFFE